jgi:hypothetical protein
VINIAYAKLARNVTYKNQQKVHDSIAEEWYHMAVSKNKKQGDIMDITLPRGSIHMPKSSHPSPSKGLIKATS